ncbi:hypothetical protein LCGC14_2712080, partial [marine sediment metagenome]
FTDGESAKMRVLVVAARRDSVENLLATVRKAGLVPELVDLSAFAMVRALYVPAPVARPGGSDGEGASGEGASGEGDGARAAGAAGGEAGLATLYCYVGGVTNLAIAVGTTCAFNRVLPNGVESMAATLAERGGLTLEHARQWLQHVGLERDTEGMEGEAKILDQARQVLQRGSARIADDVRLSMEYYQSAVPDARRVEQVIVAGPGIAIEGLPAVLEAELGLAVEPRSLGQVEVIPGVLDGVEGSELTIATGLALDEVKA